MMQIHRLPDWWLLAFQPTVPVGAPMMMRL
jgi:hypothetical protein